MNAPLPVDIKDLRRRLGGGTQESEISQVALAEMLGGISQSTVSRLEADPSLQRGPVAVLLRTLDENTPEPIKRENAA